MKTVFVILHYENLADTIECISSLQSYIKNDGSEVVLVDNGSIHGKLKDIEGDYDHSCIHFLYSESNLGFAKGNNIGFRYAKYQLEADIIILCNNDLVFKQIDFVKTVVNHYEKDHFDVAGTRIISLEDGKNQNPVPVLYSTLSKLDRRIVKYYLLYILSIFNLDTVVQKRVAKEIEEYHPSDNDDFQLFGACLIFANKYLDSFDGLYDKTFMYNEESILKERVKRHFLQMKYYDDIEVMHKEGASTKAIYGKGKKKRQFFYRWNINSCWLLRKIIRGAEI